MWCAEGGLVEAVDEGLQRLVFFMFDAEEREGCGLMWAAVADVSSEHVGGGVEAINGVWG